MANRNYPLDAETLKFVEDLPALALVCIRKETSGRFTATLDLGPGRQLADPCPIGRGGATPQEAAESMKAWLLGDLACTGLLGKRQYQPHMDRYDVVYRHGEYWSAKLAQLPAIEAEMLLLQVPAPLPVADDYEGWTNSATYLVNLYTTQSPVLHARVVALFKAGRLTAAQLQKLVPVVRNQASQEGGGYALGRLHLDDWALGSISWSEMAENWLAELTPTVRHAAEMGT